MPYVECDKIIASLKVYCPNGSCKIRLAEMTNQTLVNSIVNVYPQETVQEISLAHDLTLETPTYIGIRIDLINLNDIVFVDELYLGKR